MKPTHFGCALACMFATSTQMAVAADWTVSGMLRQEVAIKLTDDQNHYNWGGNSFNGVAVENQYTKQVLGTSTTLMRPESQKESPGLNMFATRLELNLDGRLDNNWAAHFKLRGFSDQLGHVESAYRDVNLFKQQYGTSSSGGVLGIAQDDWMLDLPVAYLDYSDGPLWVRIGNQQIAWGESLFFRVSDVANGLDLRRHSIMDVGAEEFSDKRVSSPAVRTMWRGNDRTELEGFAQLFRPSVLPTENSAYNAIPAQFIVDQESGYRDVDDKINFGIRLRTEFDNLGLQLFAVRRNNPDGVYRWSNAKGSTAVGESPFSGQSGVGVYSAAEWFKTASMVRLDGFGALESALNEFNTAPLGASALAGACGASGTAGTASTTGTISVNSGSAGCILDGFFSGGDLRGWLVREYPRENVFGFGLNTVFSGEPDSLLDQLIGRFELSYTPNKKFTSPTLSREYIEDDELAFAFIFEKYHKFSRDLPATYMVFQWMHKSASDIFGRSLEGYGNTPGSAPKGQSGGANYIALVAQQPTPSLEWRFDVAVLTDLKGGWYVQPGVKWKLNRSAQLDIYGNFFRSDNDGRDFADGLEYAKEVFVRGTWYF